MSDKWTYTAEEAHQTYYNIGDEYYKDGEWITIETYRDIDEVIRQGYIVRHLETDVETEEGEE